MLDDKRVAVFDIGGTWFRWGLYGPGDDLQLAQRAQAINYLSHPTWSAADLQLALARFVVDRARQLRETAGADLRLASIALGAPINANDMTVLGSGPLWGPNAKPFSLYQHLCEMQPDFEWHVFNDVAALLAPYMDNSAGYRRTMLITVSSGVGSRLYDHRSRKIPYDATHGVQGEIGHLVYPFELDGKLIRRQCECGGWNHINAFASGRGIASLLRDLPALSSIYGSLFEDDIASWREAGDAYRLQAFQAQIERESEDAQRLLDAFVTPLSRTLAAALSIDPEIDRIVITGGVAQGLGEHYRESLRRTFLRDGLYQITDFDPDYLTRRLLWESSDDYSGLRGAGVFALSRA
jgi:glucokinase